MVRPNLRVMNMEKRYADNPDLARANKTPKTQAPVKWYDKPIKRATLPITIRVPYIGSVLSVNHYKYNGGRYTRPEVKRWMELLAWKLGEYRVEWNTIRLPLYLNIGGVFKDKRSTPDIHNIIKIIADCIEDVTGLNDKGYSITTDAPVVDKNKEPELIITIDESHPNKGAPKQATRLMSK